MTPFVCQAWYWVASWVCLLCVIWRVQTLDARPREDGYGSE